MSQTIIPVGIDASIRVMRANAPATAEEISACFNEAIRLINGNLTDANFRVIEVGNTGYPETDIEWANHGDVGHNHDGVNSAPLHKGTVDSRSFNQDQEFLNAAWDTANVPPAHLPVIVSGKVIGRFDLTATGASKPSFTVAVPFDDVEMDIQSTQLRIVASAWYSVSSDPTQDIHQIATSAVINSTYVSAGRETIEFTLFLPIRGAANTITYESGYFGVHWMAMVEADFSDPTA
jgi:hypothetical protein